MADVNWPVDLDDVRTAAVPIDGEVDIVATKLGVDAEPAAWVDAMSGDEAIGFNVAANEPVELTVVATTALITFVGIVKRELPPATLGMVGGALDVVIVIPTDFGMVGPPALLVPPAAIVVEDDVRLRCRGC